MQSRAMSDPQSPDYHLYLKGNPEALVGKTIVQKDDGVLGVVCDYDSYYHIEDENTETGETTHRRIKDMQVVDQIRKGNWWVE